MKLLPLKHRELQRKKLSLLQRQRDLLMKQPLKNL
jgi:hypothetical protein